MKKMLILIFIFFLAAVLRLNRLGEVPPSPDWDEAALGYNAYSILKTGRDEYGTFLPLSIRSFDDYKPPLYVYLTVPSVAIFGLSVWSTRLPSAVMGTLAVIGTFFFVYELFRTSRFRYFTATFSSLLLAISPWHLQFSRIAFEANTGITLNIFGVAAFLIGLRKRVFLPIAAACFGLAFYAYHSERVFVPLIVVTLMVIFRKALFVQRNRKHIFLSIIIGVSIITPLLPVVFNHTALMRLRGTSSFTDQTGLLSRNIQKINEDRALHDKVGELIDNRRIVFIKTIADGYLSHFSLRWLFLTGDNPRHHAPDMGLLYLWELPFIFLGLFFLVRDAHPDIKKLMISWLLVAPVAAAPTTGLPHAIRSLVFLPIFQILTAMGIVAVYQKRKWVVIAFLFFALINIGYYLNMYYTHQNKEYSQYWQYGYREAVALTEKLKAKYKKVVVSTQLEQSYMFFLFYTRFDPQKYLANGGTKSGSFDEAQNAFDMYEFRKINWSNEIRDGSILYVGAPGDMPHGNIANIKFLNGDPAIEIADQPNGAP